MYANIVNSAPWLTVRCADDTFGCTCVVAKGEKFPAILATSAVDGIVMDNLNAYSIVSDPVACAYCSHLDELAAATVILDFLVYILSCMQPIYSNDLLYLSDHSPRSQVVSGQVGGQSSPGTSQALQENPVVLVFNFVSCTCAGM